MNNAAIIIEKEEISNFKMLPAQIDQSAKWIEKLSYAVRLGNEFKGKTSITFNTAEGERTVETTVWSLTDRYIQLKGGILIPLTSITDVSN
ncbi:MAG: hypothetical protein BGO09_08135 [Bacteroidetes bacterium 47-18]|nr:MAG: hypothetical protein BGO09_08135 [Bacteroidetes bacterium 47-18]